MISIHREMILELLLDLPILLDLYEDVDPRFGAAVLKWLHKGEQNLARLRSPLVGSLSAQRGKVLALQDGIMPDGCEIDRRNRRKRIRAGTALVLHDVESALNKIVVEIDENLKIYRDKMAQLIAVVSATNVIPLPPTEPRNLWLEKVWQSIEPTPETQHMLGYLNASLSKTDLNYLLDEVLGNLLSQANIVST